LTLLLRVGIFNENPRFPAWNRLTVLGTVAIVEGVSWCLNWTCHEIRPLVFQSRQLNSESRVCLQHASPVGSCSRGNLSSQCWTIIQPAHSNRRLTPKMIPPKLTEI